MRAIAVCLLHAYANDAHERAVAEALAPLGLPMSLLVGGAAAAARVRAHVDDGGRRLRAAGDGAVPGAARRAAGRRGVRVLASNGGAMSAADAAAQPARTLLSGPAAGVVGALAVARACGVADAITLDMGGTSTDVALIAGGQVALDRRGDRGRLRAAAADAGHPHRRRRRRIRSRASTPAARSRSGRESAGAEPGPAAYDRGGTRPTVTDANLVLGRLPPAGLLGGAMPLSRERARARRWRRWRERLGVAVEQAAEDLLAVAAAVMARAIKVVSVERGHDPARFTLLPFGGAGALHACAVARELGMTRILVPPSPGLLCAYGALAADVVHDFVATRDARRRARAWRRATWRRRSCR